ncbi:Cytochrome c-551 [Paenibacillus solanacearum]|uniref:Cytochrome c-551 n=2 Tax=Paenibacillus solanacearum TaxID=2048548 RepID=A0A916NH34_9BACL|nr:cytochrome c [Paenibacillus solanacearum]CAG7607088.1 Cytochrome c-551 [Paenibacillus solanacearum]
MRKTVVYAALLFALSLSVSACGKTNTAPPANQGGAATGGGTAGGAATADAQAIYKQNCISCHGNNLEGGVGPNLQKAGSKYSKEQIATLLSNGKGAMPSFKGRLSDTELGAVADWLAAKK